MNDTNPELRAAIDTAKQRVNVDSYFTTGMNKSIKGRAQGFWAGTMLGIASGSLAGLFVTAVLTFAFPAVAFSGVAVVLGFAGIGAVAGGAAGAEAGAGTGVVAGIVGEFERRQKAEKLETEILKSPEKQAEAIAAYRANPVVEKDDTLQETFATSASRSQAFGKLFDMKTTLVAMALCAGAGVLMVTGGFLLAGVGAGGVPVGIAFGALKIASVAQAVGVGAAIGAATGVTFGINYPMIFASATQWTADLLSQKMVRGQSNFGHVKTVSEVQQEASANRAVSEQSSPMKLTLAKDAAPSTVISDIHAEGRQAPALQLVKS